jgi:hypothetical protein
LEFLVADIVRLLCHFYSEECVADMRNFAVTQYFILQMHNFPARFSRSFCKFGDGRLVRPRWPRRLAQWPLTGSNQQRRQQQQRQQPGQQRQ